MVELKVRCIKCGTLRIVKVYSKNTAGIETFKRNFKCDDCLIKAMRERKADEQN